MPGRADAIVQRGTALRTLVLAEVARATQEELTFRPSPDRWSVRETLIHIGNWEEEGCRYLRCLFAGEPITPSGPSDINEWNAEAQARYAHLDVEGAVAYITRVRQELDALSLQVTDEQIKQDRQYLGVLLMSPDHEAGHLHQIREALALARGDQHEAALAALRYARQRVLTRLNLEDRPTAALLWQPESGKWSIREHLIHLGVWDRYWADAFRSGAVSPLAPEQVDQWNREQVAVRQWMTLADVLHELGAARGALEEQMQLQPAAEIEPAWIERLKKHDDEHMYSILKLLQEWRKANPPT